MNENAKKWVEALRSGKYKQTKRCLRNPEGFCCLGVACELAVQAGVIPPALPKETGEFLYGIAGTDSSSTVLPMVVKNWLGLSAIGGSYRNGYAHDNLAQRNDMGASFEDIAALIESQPDGLFVE